MGRSLVLMHRPPDGWHPDIHALAVDGMGRDLTIEFDAIALVRE